MPLPSPPRPTPVLLLSVLVGAGLALPAGAGAQSLPSAAADSVFAPWDRDDTPGCAVGVFRQGELLLARGYGLANLDWGIPITPSTVFYAGSVSKQFAAATAALMHLDGTLDLDADVRLHIPELPPYDPVVTVRHLVHHTSGVRDIYGLINLSGGRVADAWTDAEYLELLARQVELNFPAGSAHLYSNGGYFLLTTVIERASGKRLDAVARELLFEPLGMHDTHFHQESTRIVPRRAMSYEGNPGAGYRQSYLGNFDKAGAGGLYTTLADLAAWDRNLATGEVGGAAFLELMLTPGRLSSGEELTYAFGLTHGTADGRATVGHGGSMMGFRADYVRFPDDDLSVAALCNLGSINPGPLTRRVARGLLGPAPTARAPGDAEASGGGAGAGAAPGAAPPALPSAALPAYAGTYRSEEVGAEFRITWDGTTLGLQRTRTADPRPLEPVGSDRFRDGSQTLDFLVEDGVPVGFRLDAGRVRNLLFQRVPEA